MYNENTNTFNIKKGSYSEFKNFLYYCVSIDKIRSLYVIINSIEDFYDIIMNIGKVQKTISIRTADHNFARSIFFYYYDELDNLRDYMRYTLCCEDIENYKYEAIYDHLMTKFKKYEKHKGANEQMKIKEPNEKGVLTEKDLSKAANPEPITDVKDVTRESLLDGAYKCICCDRNKQYGSPEDNFGIIARYWKEYLGVDITAMDVGIMMTLFKIGRMQSGGYKPDNFVDAIGYLACAGECGAKFNVDDGNKCGYGKCTDCWMKEEE